MTTEDIKPYTSVEIALYQVIAAQGSVTEELYKRIHGELLEEPERFEDPELIQELQSRTLDDSIELINERIKFINERITRITHQTEHHQKLYVLISSLHHTKAAQNESGQPLNNGSNTSLNALAFTPNEIGAINRLISTIIQDNDVNEKYLVSGKEALRIVTAETSYPASQSQRFLHKLVTEGFFIQSSQGRYMLSNKTLAELKEYLIQEYSTRKEGGLINICIGCEDILTVGFRCPNEECWVRLHKGCRYPYQRANDTACRECGTDWNGDADKTLYVGELSLSRTD